MSRMTDNDKHFGPFTIGPWSKTIGLYAEGGDPTEDEGPRGIIRLIAFGWAIQMNIPIKWIGRQYGFTLSDMSEGCGYNFFQLFYGRNTMDGSKDQSWSKHLPWKEWDHVRHSLYRPDGTLFLHRADDMEFTKYLRKKDECPKTHFGFEDYDEELIVATCTIEEREWHRGVGWFKWLRFFYSPKVVRSLDIKFSQEMGPDKGSWKGGTLGHGINMYADETPEQAFMRYCRKEHNARERRKYHIRYIGPCNPPPEKKLQAEDLAEKQS